MKGLLFLLAGFGVGAVIRIRKPAERRRLTDLESALSALDTKATAQAALQDGRLDQLETRVQAHETCLGKVQSNAQTLALMEELVESSMARIDHRFSACNESIEVLRAAVVRSEKLMEAVLADLRCVTEVNHGPSVMAR